METKLSEQFVDFEDQTEETPTVDFTDEATNAPQLNDAAIAEKKKVLQFATKDDENKFSDAHLNFIYRNQGEGSIRQMMAEQELIKMTETKNQVLGQLLQGGDTSPEVVEAVASLSSANFTSPENVQKSAQHVIERKFAEKAVLEAFSREDLDYDESTQSAMDITENLITRTAILRNLLQEEGSAFSDKSLVQKAGSIAINFIPFVSIIGTNRAFDGEHSSSILQGNNQREQAEYLWSIQDPVEFQQTLVAEYQERKEEYGHSFALTWLSAFLNYGSSDEFLDNVFSGIELGTAGVSAGIKAAKLGKGLVKGVATKELKIADIASNVGDMKTSALATVQADNLVTELPVGWDKLKKVTESLFDFENFIGETDKISQASINRVTLAAKTRANQALQLAVSNKNVDALNPQELATIADDAFDELLNTYTNSQNNLLDVEFTGIPSREVIEAQDTANNLNMVVLRFGRRDGALFESKSGATKWARQYAHLTDDFVVKSKGSKYYVELKKYVAEDKVSNIQIATEAQTPVGTMGILDTILRPITSDSYLVSKQQVADRAVITSRIEAVARLAEPLMEPIKNLPKKAQKELEDILQLNNSFVGKDGERGKWFDLEELVGSYQQLHNRTPTDQEIDAYYSLIQINDFEYLLRDMNYTKQLVKGGFEQVSIKLGGEGDSVFAGKVLDNIEFGDEYFNFRVVDDKGAILARGDNKKFNRDKLQGYLDQGYKVIQPADGLVKVGDENATLVVAKVFKRNNMPMQQVQYRAGGHAITESPYFVKAADIHVTDNGTRIYRGDITIANAATAKQAEEIAGHFQTLGEMINSNKMVEARRYVADNLPNNDFDQVLDWFNSGKIPKGKITATRSGERTLDQSSVVKGTDFDHDGTANAFNFRSQIAGKFIGRRDAANVSTVISEKGALSWSDSTPMMRPLAALNEGIKESVRGLNMNDYIAKSADQFAREFIPIMEGVTEKQFRRNPVYYMTNPVFKAGANPLEVQAAKKYAQAVKNMIGQQTEVSRKLDVMKEKIIDWAFDKGGPKSKLYNIVSERLLPTVEDPTVYFRSTAFQTKMGFFNPKHVFLQSQVLTNIIALQPKEAFPALAAHNYSFGLFLNPRPAILKDADARMAKYGWKSGWFEESHTAGLDSGWFDVGGDAAILDKISDPSLTGGKVGKFLDTGLAFYKKGEQISRVTAWHAAYLTWKKANPNKTLRRQDAAALMVRARDLTANMSRDQNAWWQRGVASVPTQFWGFQMRMMEQMISPRSRLTVKERARLFAGISAMYGVPVGVGAGVGVWPIAEEVKKYMMETGMDQTVEESFFLETLRDGILATAVEMATGIDVDTSNYGPAGLPVFKDLTRQDGDWYDVFGGASAGIILDIVSGVVPSMALGQGNEPDAYDLLDVLKNISTVNNGIKLTKALNTGKWLTNNETYLGDITAQEAFISFFTGLELENFTDAFIAIEAGKDFKAGRQSGIKEATKEYSRANMALERGDVEGYKRHIKRAEAISITEGLLPSEKSTALRRGMQLESMSDKAKKIIEEDIIMTNERKKLMQQGNK